jgi:hypothetical protein
MTSTPGGRIENDRSRSALASRGRWLAVWIMLVPSAVAVSMAAALHHDIPWGDHLTLFRDTEIADGFSLESLFRFHNEHLIVPTKLAVALDYELWHGANLMPAAGCLLLLLAIVAVEVWIFRRAAADLSSGELAFVTALLAAVLINGRLTWTLTFPILFQHVSANACVVVAIAAFAVLAAGTSPHPGRALAVCLAAAGGAAISSAAGVFTLPAATAATLLVMVVSPALRRRPWRGPVLAGLLIGAGVLAVYAQAYALTAPAGRRPTPDVVQALRFAIYFPGGAWFRDGTWPIVHRADLLLLHAVVLGFWLLLAREAVRLWRRRDAVGEFELFHTGVILFVLMTAAVGGLFRGGLGDLEALNKKYSPTALLAWASLVSVLVRDRLPWLFAGGPRGVVRPLGVAVVTVAAILPGDVVEYRAWAAWRDELESAITAYAAGVRTDAVLLHFFPDRDQADRLLAAIERDGSYWFRHQPRRPWNTFAAAETARETSLSGPAPEGDRYRPTWATPDPLAADLLASQHVGGRLDRIPDHTDYSIEFINETERPLGKPPTRLSRDSGLRLTGWAVDREAGGPPTAIDMILDGTRYRCRGGLPRSDVAAFFTEPGFAAAGFECLLPAGTLVPGEHSLKLWIGLADGQRYLETPTYRLVVE